MTIESIVQHGETETIYLIHLDSEDITYQSEEWFIYYRTIDDLRELYEQLKQKVIGEE